LEKNIVTRKIQEDLKTAVKARDKVRTSALRMLITSLKNAELEEREELTQEQEIAVLGSYARKCRESLSEFERGGRDDLVAQGKAELAVVMSYLPEQLSEEDIRSEALKIIKDTGAAGPGDMGKVMGLMMARLKGKADGASVRKVVSDILERN
jgi:hypothetical protein